MKKPDEPWQPLLLDIGKKPEPETKPEPRVEYEQPIRRRPAAGDAPWWQRAKQAEAVVRSPATDLSWGALWTKLLASEGWIESMRAGRRNVLEMSVRGLDVHAGVVEAAFANAKTKPERVQLRLPPLTSAEWARLARQSLEDDTAEVVSAGLLAGRIPMGLVDASDHHGIPLIPRRVTHVLSACTCGGAALPCDHVIAVHMALCRKLDAEPLALLGFRGGNVEELLALIARVREETQSAPKPNAVTVETDPFAPGPGAAPEWELLARPTGIRPPLPLPESWRGRETVDAMVHRILDTVRARAKPSPSSGRA